MTAPKTYHGLTIGETWHKAPNALVDNVFLGSEPADVGINLSPGVFESLLSDPGSDFDFEGQSGETLAALSFENRFNDLSEYDSVVRHGDSDNLAEGLDGQAYRIGDRDRIELDRSNEQIHSLDKFALELEIQLLEDDSTGRFLHFYKVMDARIEDDRSISFSLKTDEGSVKLNSGDVTFDDGEPHVFAVAYDDAAGRVAMSIDDRVVDSAELTGATAPKTYHGLTIGETWHDAPTALIDNFFLGTEPADVGIDLAAAATDTMYNALMDGMVPEFEEDALEDDDVEADPVAA
jgi:hypothetical protein